MKSWLFKLYKQDLISSYSIGEDIWYINVNGIIINRDLDGNVIVLYGTRPIDWDDFLKYCHPLLKKEILFNLDYFL